MDPDIRIDRFTTIDAVSVCVDLQRQVWRYPDNELVPAEIFVVAAKTGGHVLIAFDHEKPIGFSLALAGFRDDLRYLHSHMAGVLPEYQNFGIGRKLKLRQREDALSCGISLIEWTFDPLALRNAYFNITRLGAVIRRSYPNLYGITASPLHGGLPTDRLVAEWWLGSEHVTDAINGKLAPIGKNAIEIAVPVSIAKMTLTDPQHATTLQSHIRAEFERSFAAGYTVTAFRLDQENGVYILEHYEN